MWIKYHRFETQNEGSTGTVNLDRAKYLTTTFQVEKGEKGRHREIVSVDDYEIINHLLAETEASVTFRIHQALDMDYKVLDLTDVKFDPPRA